MAEKSNRKTSTVLFNIISWILTVFLIISAIAFIPSISSIFMALAAAILIPLPAVQNLLKKLKLAGIIKIIAVIICIIVSGAILPQKSPDSNKVYDNSDRQTIESSDKVSDSTEVSSADNESSLPNDSTSAPDQQTETAANDTTSSAITTAAQQTEAQIEYQTAVTTEPQISNNWVLNTSTKKIHYSNCPEIKKIKEKNYSTSNASESELIAQGYTVCKRCHK